MISRDQVQAVNDLDSEELFIPEWLDEVGKSTYHALETQLRLQNGETPGDLKDQYLRLRDSATCRVWMLSAADCEKLQNKTRASLGASKEANVQNFFARLAVACVRDAEGKPLFNDNDIGWLSKKSFRALNRIANVAMRINGLSQQDQEELLKNSETTQG